MPDYKPTTIELIKAMNPAFVTAARGKDAALYTGLLAYAHETVGIQSIRVTLLQAPAEANGWTAVSHASVELKDGRIFEDIGDANATNVGNKAIALHIIRMSSTRAKARALRDSLNVNGAALEEYGPNDRNDDDDDVRPQAPVRQRPHPAPVAARVPADVDARTGEIKDPPDNAPATDRQLARIAETYKRMVYYEPELSPPVTTGLTFGGARDMLLGMVKEGTRMRSEAAARDTPGGETPL